MAEVVVAVDIGGTKIALGLFDERGVLFHREEESTVKDSAEHLFQQAVRMIQTNTQNLMFKKIVVGLPGLVKGGVAVFQNNIPWTQFPVKQRLEANFENTQVYCINDVTLATLGEWHAYGQVQTPFVYITISTGISSCTLINGQVVTGRGMAGELGFQRLQDSEETLEQSLSGQAITQLLQKEQMSWTDQREQLPESISRSLDELIQTIAAQIYTIQLLLDPSVIVLGGGVMNKQSDFLQSIQNELKKLQKGTIFENTDNVLFQSKWKGNAGLYGAYFLSDTVNEKNN